jgi:hypothetical protein
MPIIRSDGKKPVILKSHPFDNEDQLQKVVAENPSLLCFGDDAPLALVTRELTLEDAGYFDVLIISADGLPVPVKAEKADGFDKSKLNNGVLEPLREADLIQ